MKRTKPIVRQQQRPTASKKPDCPNNKNYPILPGISKLDTEDDQAKGSTDPRPPGNGSLKAPLFPALFNLNKAQNKGTQGVRARYDAELLTIVITIIATLIW